MEAFWEKMIDRAEGTSKKKEPVHVDMAAKLGEIGLGHLVPESLWPPANAVRELATSIRSVERTGQVNAFVAVNLTK